MGKKKQENVERMSEEEAFGYYFSAGYSPGGMSYCITMAEAEEKGLLEEDKEKSEPALKVEDGPFDEKNLLF